MKERETVNEDNEKMSVRSASGIRSIHFETDIETDNNMFEGMESDILPNSKSTRVRFDVSEQTLTASQTLKSCNSENDITNLPLKSIKAKKRLSFSIDEPICDEKHFNETSSQRSKSSCSTNQVKWKENLDIIADSGDESEINPKNRTGLIKLVEFLDELVENDEVSSDVSKKMKVIVNIATFEYKSMKKELKKHIIKLGNQVERLHEKVQANIMLDSRVKDQRDRLEQLEKENNILRGLGEFDDDLNNEDGNRLETLEEENRGLRVATEKIKQRLERVTRRRKSRSQSKSKNSTRVSHVDEEGEKRETIGEFGDEMMNMLKENNDNFRKTNEQLITVNDNLLERNKYLVNEIENNKKIFQNEQEQWKTNWEKLKQHYEMQFNLLKNEK